MAVRTPPSAGDAAERRSLLGRHPRRVVVVVGVLLVVANLVVVLLATADTGPSGGTLPEAVESVTPNPGELVRVQDTIGADLRNDLTGVLVLDGVEVPEDQLDRVEPLGQVSFRPGPGQELTRFQPGSHTAMVLYWPQGKPRPSRPAGFGWSFRAGA